MMMKTMFVLASLVAVTARGGSAPAPAATPAAKVEGSGPETELARVTLTAEAEAHLALTIETVSMQSVSPTRTVGGEALVPPGRSVPVTAPVAGTLAAPSGGAATIGPVTKGTTLVDLLPLQPADRDHRAEAERAAREADARLLEATQRLQRLERLLAEGSASARSVEEAKANQTVAAAAADAAHTRVATVADLPVGARGQLSLAAPFDGLVVAIHAAPGQTVAAGAPIAEVAQVDTLWMRVPVYAGDVAAIETGQPVSFTRLGDEADAGSWREARRVSAPPTADATAASVDLYFALPSSGGRIRPGERVSVRLPLRAAERAIVIPQSAVVYDVGGGSWVYEVIADHVFARRRVELGTTTGSNIVVLRGLTEGRRIVTIGAAELYGTEFFVNK
jgi:RND family efflux transporter MFP subunit